MHSYVTAKVWKNDKWLEIIRPLFSASMGDGGNDNLLRYCFFLIESHSEEPYESVSKVVNLLLRNG